MFHLQENQLQKHIKGAFKNSKYKTIYGLTVEKREKEKLNSAWFHIRILRWQSSGVTFFYFGPEA